MHSLQPHHLAPPQAGAAPPQLLTGPALRYALLGSALRQAFRKPDGFLVCLSIAEVAQLHMRGADEERQVLAQVAGLIREIAGAPFVGYEAGHLCFVLTGGAPERPILQRLARRIAAAEFTLADRALHLTPAIGYTALTGAAPLDKRIQRALAALHHAQLSGDLQPVRSSAAKSGAAHGPPSPALPAFLAGLAKRLNAPFQVLLTIMIGLVIPWLVYMGFDQIGLDITPAVYLGTVAALLVTSYLIWYECFQAIRPAQLPAEPGAPPPPASAIIAAYLPNEAATVVETIQAFLRIDYPGRLEIVLAYNTPHDLPVEAELRALAEREPRLRLLRVHGSTSKAQNVNAALGVVTGEFVGVFDADHHPAPDSFRRAWRWLAGGYDVVQGHCVIRNGGDTWVTKLVAVEFEIIYAVAHPGRARMHGFGVFGGSNGYWRTSVLRSIRMRAAMLTEDIDASIRALIEGYTIASDPLLRSYELAPLTLKALWNQRMRWAQGWFQVSLRHSWAALRSSALTVRQKLGILHLLVWREVYPWVSIQILAVLTYWIWHDGLSRINLLIPIFVLTTLLTFSSGPGQVLFAALLGDPTIRRRRGWLLCYLVGATLFYSGFKNLISRVAMVKEAMQERQWKVTPRAAQPELQRTGAEG